MLINIPNESNVTFKSEAEPYHLTALGRSTLEGEKVTISFGTNKGDLNPVTKALRRKRGVLESHVTIKGGVYASPTGDYICPAGEEITFVSETEIVWESSRPSLLVITSHPKPLGEEFRFDRETGAIIRHADALGAGGVKIVGLVQRVEPDVSTLVSKGSASEHLMGGSPNVIAGVSSSIVVHGSWLDALIAKQQLANLPTIFAWGDAPTRSFLISEIALGVMKNCSGYTDVESDHFGSVYTTTSVLTERNNPSSCLSIAAPAMNNRDVRWLYPISAMMPGSPVQRSSDGRRSISYFGAHRGPNEAHVKAGVRSYEEVHHHFMTQERDANGKDALEAARAEFASQQERHQAEVKAAMVYVANERDKFYSDLDAASIY